MVNQKKQYTRIEMARLLRERNEFKERYLSLKEKLQILQQRQEMPTPKKKEKSLWKMFSDMFKGKSNRSPNIPRRGTRPASKSEENIEPAAEPSKSLSSAVVSLSFGKLAGFSRLISVSASMDGSDCCDVDYGDVSDLNGDLQVVRSFDRAMSTVTVGDFLPVEPVENGAS